MFKNKNPKTAGSSKIAIIAIITALIIGGIYYFKNQSTDEESTTPPSVEVEGPSGLEGFIKKGSLWGWDTAGLDKAEHEIRLRAWKTANNYTDANMINLPGGELLYMYNGSGKEITAKDVLLSMALGSDSYVILISFGQDGKEQWVMTPGMAQTTIPDAKNPLKIWDITNYATDPGLHKIQAGQGYLLYLHTPKVKDEITKVTGSKSIKAFGANVQRNQDKNTLAETSTALTAGWNMTAFNNVIYKAPHFENFKITNVWEVANDGNHVGPYSIEEVTTRNTANMIWFQYGPATTEPTPTPVEPVYTKATLVIDPRPEVKMDSEIAIIVVDPDVNNADGELVVDKIEIKLKSTPPGDGKPANIKVQATETEANSGKFVAKIKVSADDSSEINLEAGNGYKVKAEYVDTTIPVQADGSTSYTATDIVTVVGEVIEPTEAKVKFVDYDEKNKVVIDKDQFEKNKKENIVLWVKDPDANTKPDEIEQVNVDLKTSSGKNKTIQLYEVDKETHQGSEDSDLFMAVIHFEELDAENIEIANHIFSEVVVGDKVFAEYGVPIIQSSNYVTIIEAPVEDGGGDEDKKNTLAQMKPLSDVKIGGQLKILVQDPDMSGKGKININVSSSTDTGGVDIDAFELEDRLGEFEASITVSPVDSSSDPNNLKVKVGEKVTAAYVDETTPMTEDNMYIHKVITQQAKVLGKAKERKATIQFLIVGNDEVVGEKLMIPGSKIKVKIVDGDVVPINTADGQQKIKYKLDINGEEHNWEASKVRDGIFESGEINVNADKYNAGEILKASYIDESYNETISVETILDKKVVDTDTDEDGVTDKEDLCKGQNDFKDTCNFRAFWGATHIPGNNQIELMLCDFDMIKNNEGELTSDEIMIDLEELYTEEDNIKTFKLKKVTKQEGRNNYTTESGISVDFPFCYSKLISLSTETSAGENPDKMKIKSSSGLDNFALKMSYIDETLPIENNEAIMPGVAADHPLWSKVVKWHSDQGGSQTIRLVKTQDAIDDDFIIYFDLSPYAGAEGEDGGPFSKYAIIMDAE